MQLGRFAVIIPPRGDASQRVQGLHFSPLVLSDPPLGKCLFEVRLSLLFLAKIQVQIAQPLQRKSLPSGITGVLEKR